MPSSARAGAKTAASNVTKIGLGKRMMSVRGSRLLRRLRHCQLRIKKLIGENVIPCDRVARSQGEQNSACLVGKVVGTALQIAPQSVRERRRDQDGESDGGQNRRTATRSIDAEPGDFAHPT